MADIVLINPPLDTRQRYGEFAEVGNELPNLGLAYLAAFMREKGVDTKIIDAPALGMPFDRIVKVIEQQNPALVGLTAATVAIGSASKLAGLIKQRNVNLPIAVGGPHISALPEQTMNEHSGFDFGVLGEGEQTLVELFEAIKSKSGYAKIAGLVYRDKRNIIRNEPRTLIENLDSLPLPAWDLLPDLSHTYRPSPQSTFRLPSTILFTTRGCPFRCTFCDRSVFGGKVRPHSAVRVFEMMEHLYRKFGIIDFAFHDESFIFDERRLVDFCNRLIGSGLDFSWVCQGRVDQKISTDTLALMKRAGCRQLQFGIETANDPLLKIMKKGTTIEKVSRALEQTKKAGISTKAFFMVGVFGETEQTLANTERFVLSAPLDDIMVSFFTPFPGSEAFEQVEQYGRLTGSFDSMNEYELVFLPNGLKATQIAKARKRIYRRFYFRPRIFGNYIKRLAEPSVRSLMLRSAWSTAKTLVG